MSVDPRARRVLREYRRASARTEQQRADVWARIEHSIDADARLDLDDEPPARRPRRAAALLVVVLSSTAAAVGVGLIPRLTSSPTPHTTAPPEAVETPNPAEPPPRPRPPNARSTAPHPEPREPAPVQRAAKKPKRADAAETEAAAEALREEMALIASARSSLLGERPGEALRTLEDHLRRFPQGQMREDRAALRIEALCRVGKHRQARIELERFTSQHPASAHLDRLRAACSSRNEL